MVAPKKWSHFVICSHLYLLDFCLLKIIKISLLFCLFIYYLFIYLLFIDLFVYWFIFDQCQKSYKSIWDILNKVASVFESPCTCAAWMYWRIPRSWCETGRPIGCSRSGQEHTGSRSARTSWWQRTPRQGVALQTSLTSSAMASSRVVWKTWRRGDWWEGSSVRRTWTMERSSTSSTIIRRQRTTASYFVFKINITTVLMIRGRFTVSKSK